MNFVTNLLEIFLPRNCAVCGRKMLSGEKWICTSCLSDQPRTFFCESVFNPMSGILNGKTSSFVNAAACFHYRDGWKNITKSLKYEGFRGPASFIAERFGRELSKSLQYRDVTVVVPVPLHWTRRIRRGYNQAEIIARALAGTLDSRAEYCPGLLCRIRRTRSQASIDRSGKEANVAGALSVDANELHRLVRKACTGPADSEHAPFVKILIVDDVFTTGATLAECCRALEKAAAETNWKEIGFSPPVISIAVATLAFAGD